MIRLDGFRIFIDDCSSREIIIDLYIWILKQNESHRTETLTADD